MAKNSVASILSQYDEARPRLDRLAQKTETLVKELLGGSQISVQSINSRVKERPSVEEKIKRREGKYSSIYEMTDVCGLRIITYYDSDVEFVSQVLKKEFQVDEDNTVDKRMLNDPNMFGYRSMHLVVSMSKERLCLTEYAQFSNDKVEIQVRSILQHAWAEIEHDLGYKAHIAVPTPLRRRFSRLAGLIEIADNEFVELRSAIYRYREDAKKKVKEENVYLEVNADTIAALVANSELVKKVDREIAGVVGRSLIMGFSGPEYFSSLAARAQSAGYSDIATLVANLQERQEELLDLATIYWRDEPRKKATFLVRGISIRYLLYLVVTERHGAPDLVMTSDVPHVRERWRKTLEEYFDKHKKPQE